MFVIFFFITIVVQISLHNSLEFATDAGFDVHGKEIIHDTPLLFNHPAASKRNRMKASTRTSSGDKSFDIQAVMRSLRNGEKTAKQIRSAQKNIMTRYRDTSVKPCDDFHQYACGNWEKVNPLPGYMNIYDTYKMMKEILDLELKDLLSEKDKDCLDAGIETQTTFKLLNARDSIEDIKRRAGCLKEKKVKQRSIDQTKSSDRCRKLSNVEQKAKYFYQSCIDTDMIQKRGATPLIELIKYLGGWPVLEGRKWQEKNFDSTQLAGILRLYNTHVFFAQRVLSADPINSNEKIILFNKPELIKVHTSDLDDDHYAYILTEYQKFVSEILTLLGASENESVKASKSIVDFDVKLAAMTAATVKNKPRYYRMTIRRLQELAPYIDWHRYLEIVLERPVARTEVILTIDKQFMQDLSTLLNETDTKTIANYMFWRFMYDQMDKLSDRYLMPRKKFLDTLFVSKEEPPRWKACVDQVNSGLGLALGVTFLRRYFDEESKQATMAMAHGLKDVFLHIFHGADWIDAPTKSLAEAKINAMSWTIGYHDFILDSEALEEVYEDLQINPKQYFENKLNLLLDSTRRCQSQLDGEPIIRTMWAWDTVPASVIPFYNLLRNQVVVPAGILQPPFYHRHFPRALNFGGIGATIGHEITHGFTSRGHLFDGNGNLNRKWSNSSIENFDNRAKCLVSQYANYSKFGLSVDGIMTLDENIADNAGIKQAFTAYENWLRDFCKTPECLQQERLPRWNFTNKQLFFLNYAQSYCEVVHPGANENTLHGANYSPSKFRVIGSLSNSEEFARAFSCAPGTPMNPVNKCSVW